MSGYQGDFANIRAEFGLPSLADTAAFAAHVLAEAEKIAAAELPADVLDLTDLPFVTIDPPDAQDLDQAVFIERSGEGFTVHYAIADLGAVIEPGGAIDIDVRRRVHTFYLPDGKVPLHPPVLSEGACSLLPDQVRRAVVWTIEVGADGGVGGHAVRRALVKSVAKLDYEGVSKAQADGSAHASIEALADFGKARTAWRLARGATELAIAEQEVVRDGDAWRLVWRDRNPADAANAEVSLLTGMVAADIMLKAGVGLLRILPPAPEAELELVRKKAAILGIDWPDGRQVGEVLAGLDADDPKAMAFRDECGRLLRGAGYVAFAEGKPPVADHTGIGGPYAHVTAPLRRLGDRFATEVCLALTAEEEIPAWAHRALSELPDLLKESDRRGSGVERAVVDQVEAGELAHHVGDSFAAVVVDTDDDRGAEVVLEGRPHVLRLKRDGLADGDQVSVTVRSVDVDGRDVVLA